MQWTEELPTHPGWYWRSLHPAGHPLGRQPDMVEVIRRGMNQLYAWFHGGLEPCLLTELPASNWAGPIPYPDEPGASDASQTTVPCMPPVPASPCPPRPETQAGQPADPSAGRDLKPAQQASPEPAVPLRACASVANRDASVSIPQDLANELLSFFNRVDKLHINDIRDLEEVTGSDSGWATRTLFALRKCLTRSAGG